MVRARSKPVGRLAGTGDENLAAASRCCPPDSRSKLCPALPPLPFPTHPPTFSLALFLAASRSHTLRAPRRFSMKLSRCIETRRTTTTITAAAAAAAVSATTTTITATTLTTARDIVVAILPLSTPRRDHLRRAFAFTRVSIRQCVAYGGARLRAANFPLLSRFSTPSLPPVSSYSFRSDSPLRPCRVACATPFSTLYIYIYIPCASFSTSPPSFIQLFPTPTRRAHEPTTTLPATYAVYISRVRCFYSLSLSLSIPFSLPSSFFFLLCLACFSPWGCTLPTLM